jgi:class 3 adenylate cyclase
MEKSSAEYESYLSQVRLLLEELCCDLCRFEHVRQDGLAPESIRIDRECSLGQPGTFADIRVLAPNHAAYFVEVKHGYSNQALIKHLRRKYGEDTASLKQAAKVVLVVDTEGRPDWQAVQSDLPQCLRPGLKLEIWNEERLLSLLFQVFGIRIKAITPDRLLDVRQAIDQAKGYHAFGGPSLTEYHHDPLRAELIWHFGFWRLGQLREGRHLTPREVLPPGLYRGVAVLLADLCSFSSYVRDTREDEVVRHCLTSFYSKARYQILNNGGMFYQFVGDEVIGLFGIPDRQPGCVQHALETARTLVDIGNSVSNHWQRHIDRVQESGGMHIGMALGDLQIVSLRPFSRTHMGAIGDTINVAARLTACAGPSEIVVSNSFYYELEEAAQAGFQETEPLQARNVGRIKAWKLNLRKDS